MSVSPLNILVADDDDISGCLFNEVLGKEYHVDVVKNGREALLAHEVNKYDLILMDIKMPIMDGYEATKEIRQGDSQVPILAVTAGVRGLIDESFFTDVLYKPVMPEDLLTKVKEYFQ